MKYYFLTLLLSVWCFNVLAHGINGKVLDTSGLPIDQVLVLNQTNDQHTHTDHHGEFMLEQAERGDTIIFSHMAYETFQLVITTDHQIEITLTEKVIELKGLSVVGGVDALNMITKIDLNTAPVNSSQDILRKVPGLIIGQHAGGGKAEQIFLRGFDIDHGTDIAISVDGMPVNMVSHAHGQGYADLHFLIPETIENIDFGKGTYYADKGNFSTAGYVGFKTKDRLKENVIQTEVGQFNSKRTLGMLNILSDAHQSAYIATEYLSTDGPFESSQNFSRLNIMGKYSGTLANEDQFSVALSHFTSGWDASGQIPTRAVASGLISRFGAIDDTEGGSTSRTNAIFSHTAHINDQMFVESSGYLSHYDFELYSNFTFYLDDPVNGDQIKQKEARNIYGFQSEWNYFPEWGQNSPSFRASLGLRNDETSATELSHTLNRQQLLDSIKLGDIHETNQFAYADMEWRKGKWLINPALRFDYFQFNYYDRLAEQYETQAETKGIFSPKLNIIYEQSKAVQYYLKSGIGFHSNDTRVVVLQKGDEILPKAYSGDLGAIWKPFDNLLINAALWSLFLEQEFVYVGDAGIVEQGGRTFRAGVDLSLRWQLIDWLFFDTNVNYVRARAIDDPEGEDYIPLAPDLTATGGLSVKGDFRWYGGINYRFVKDRPANEDNSIVAEGYTVFDANVGYSLGKFDLGLKVQNLFDVDWNETQFATESRLYDEAASVEEIHFTPGTPFFLQGMIRFKF